MLWLRWGEITPMRGICVLDRIVWCITQGKYRIFVSFISVNPLHPYSHSLTYTRCIAIKQQYIPHTNTNSPAMIFTYGKVLSAIEKALCDLVEEY